MLGYRFCLHLLGLGPWPLRVESKLGSRRATDRDGDQHLVQTFPSVYAPSTEGDSALFEHLEFALRYEGVDLAALGAIFAHIDPSGIANWVQARPTGKYARKLGFLYEWLTGREVPLSSTLIAGPYEPILDGSVYFTGPAVNVGRWHVRNNLLGTPDWCPIVHRATLRGEPIGELNIAASLRDARAHVPPDVFERALSYAYLAETQASYAIEHDAPTPTQKHAFLRALQTAGDLPVSARLTPERLTELQELVFHGIMTFVTHGPRGDDTFIGGPGRMGLRRVDYPCPPGRAVEFLLQGLRDAAAGQLAAPGVAPVVFAGAVAFGFVFIHPLNDGNGRVHRFLIHEALVERGAVERGALIPVSATMLAQIRDYDAALRAYSRSVRVAAEEIAGVPFTLESTEPFSFPNYERVAPLYRYPVLTDQIAYLEKTIKLSIDENLLEESRFLVQFDHARSRIRDGLNLPAERLDLLIQLIHQNGGILSKTKRQRHFVDLSDTAVQAAEEAVKSAFPPESIARLRKHRAGDETSENALLFDAPPDDDWPGSTD